MVPELARVRRRAGGAAGGESRRAGRGSRVRGARWTVARIGPVKSAQGGALRGRGPGGRRGPGVFQARPGSRMAAERARAETQAIQP